MQLQFYIWIPTRQNYLSRDIFSTLITATVTFCTSIDFAVHHTIRYHLISSSGNASTHCFSHQLLPPSVSPLDGSSLPKWDTFSVSACSCWGIVVVCSHLIQAIVHENHAWFCLRHVIFVLAIISEEFVKACL